MIPTIDINALLDLMLNKPLEVGFMVFIVIVGSYIAWLASRQNGYLGLALAVLSIVVAWGYGATYF